MQTAKNTSPNQDFAKNMKEKVKVMIKEKHLIYT
jgi:hypothetical protein